MTQRWRTSLLVWLLVVTILPLIPVILFATGVTASLLDRLHREQLAAVTERAAAAATAVDSRLAAANAALAMLASGEAARQEDPAALVAHAQRYVATQRDGTVIELHSADGQLIYSTAAAPLALAQALPVQNAGPPPPEPRALLARQRTSGEPGGVGAGYELTMTVPTQALNRLLQQLAWPEGWVAAVLDPQRLIVGRSQDADRFVGRPATPSLQAMLDKGAAGVFEAYTQEGVLVFTAVAPVGRSDWRVAVGAPKAVLTRDYQRTLGLLTGGASLSLLLAGLASWWVAQWLRRRVRRMLTAAEEAAAGAPDSLSQASILELEPMTEALREAHVRERQQSGELDQARHDPLTGLSTRAWLLRRAQAQLDGVHRVGDSQERHAALFIDLDGFKEVNDAQGHQRGDQVLAEVGGCILDAVRGHDLAGRWGGDEFVVWLSASPALITPVARAVAERIVQRVAMLGDGIACSIGVAADVEGRCAVEELISRADEAMLTAKRTGKNRVVLVMP